MQRILYAHNTLSKFLSHHGRRLCSLLTAFVDVGGNVSITNQIYDPNEGMPLLLQ
jgi:hypothetical protein